MVRDALIRGLVDEEIRLDILGETKQDMTLETVIAYIEAKESGKRSASRILGEAPTSTAAITSSYRRQVKGRTLASPSDLAPPTTPCGHCGKPGHGRTRRERQKECPAYNHNCSRCGIPPSL